MRVLPTRTPSVFFTTLLYCSESKEERDREQKILGILEGFRLQGGPYQTELIMAKSGDRLLGAVSPISINPHFFTLFEFLQVVWTTKTC